MFLFLVLVEFLVRQVGAFFEEAGYADGFFWQFKEIFVLLR